jgi:hypothetical protein
MNKEQITGDAYKNYRSKSKDLDLPENLYNKLIDDLNKDAMFPIDNPNRMLSKEQFINKCKTDPEFSEKWGLKIEERELSLEERKRIYEMEYTNDIEVENNHWLESKLKTRNIPTKQIILTYNNEIIESYE